MHEKVGVKTLLDPYPKSRVNWPSWPHASAICGTEPNVLR